MRPSARLPCCALGAVTRWLPQRSSPGPVVPQSVVLSLRQRCPRCATRPVPGPLRTASSGSGSARPGMTHSPPHHLSARGHRCAWRARR
eukprot:5295012-Lingulodinium_polyedra.AAC.2